MKVENNKMVAVNYTLTVDGQIADQSQEGAPLQFILSNTVTCSRSNFFFVTL